MNVKQMLLKSSLVFLTASVPVAIHAHDVWIEMKDFRIQKNMPVECMLPSDHAFPSTNNEFVAADNIAPSYLIAPGGSVIRIAPAENNINRSVQKPARPGSYLAVTGKKWTCWVKTTEGHVEGKNKTQVKGAIKGIYSGKFGKAVITVETPGGTAFSRVVGHELEIVPLKDPGTLSKGDTLPIKVLFKGRPAEMEVKATYDDYSSKKNVFAETIKTDSRGLGEIKIKKKGKWLVRVGHTEEAKNTRLYDQKMYAATLTFQIH